MVDRPESNWTASFLVVGAMLAGLAVALGAFGAHGLKNVLDASALVTFETAVRYQMYHALGVIAIAVIGMQPAAIGGASWLRRSCQLLVAGTAVFSGTLYVLVGTGISWLGAVTPLGGVALMLGWASLAIAGLRMRRLPRTAA